MLYCYALPESNAESYSAKFVPALIDIVPHLPFSAPNPHRPSRLFSLFRIRLRDYGTDATISCLLLHWHNGIDHGSSSACAYKSVKETAATVFKNAFYSGRYSTQLFKRHELRSGTLRLSYRHIKRSDWVWDCERHWGNPRFEAPAADASASCLVHLLWRSWHFRV